MKNLYIVGIAPGKVASASLSPYGKGWAVTDLIIPEEHQGQGYDDELLQLITEDADREKVILYADTKPDSPKHLNIRYFYVRHDFRRSRGWFIRKPWYKT